MRIANPITASLSAPRVQLGRYVRVWNGNHQKMLFVEDSRDRRLGKPSLQVWVEYGGFRSKTFDRFWAGRDTTGFNKYLGPITLGVDMIHILDKSRRSKLPLCHLRWTRPVDDHDPSAMFGADRHLF